MRPTLLLTLTLTLLPACTQLPDVQPYADATSHLATTVSAVGTPVAQSIANAYDPALPDTRAAARTRAATFKTEWAKRARVVDAFAQYADGLAAVANAGNQGEAAARQVTDQFTQLLETLKGTGLDAASQAVATAAQKLYGEYTRHRAATTLAAAVAANQPAVRELAAALATDWDALTVLADSSYDQATTVLLAESDKDRGFVDELGKRRQQARARLLAPANATDTAAARENLEQLDRLYRQTIEDPAYKQSVQSLRDLDAQRAATLTLIDQAKRVTAEWARAHDQLALALRERRPVSFRRLLQLSEELLQTYEKARPK